MSSLEQLIKEYEDKVNNPKPPRDYTQNYDEIMKNIAGAYESGFQSEKSMLERKAESLGGQYRQERGKAYVTSKKNAAAVNERLASAGLARALGEDAASGVSEKSRAEQNADMLSAISRLNTNETTDRKNIEDSIISLKQDSELKTADALSELEMQKLSAEQSQDRFARQYDLDMYNTLLDAYSQQLEREQATREFAYAQQQAAISQAYTELNTYGKIVSDTAANALGVSVGTTKKSLRRK